MIPIKRQLGFTLLEVLITIAVITILAAIVIVAVNPAQMLGNARNAQRRADINTILNAVYQHAIDNNGAISTSITTTPTEICRSEPPTSFTCTGLIDLSALTASGKYLVKLPADPSGPNTNGTKYQISKDANNRVTVSTTVYDPPATGNISVTR